MELLEPLKIKNVEFQNRIVMAPMYPFGYPDCQDGSMGEELLNHYRKRAVNRIGLMISQSLSVTSKTSAFGAPGAYSEAHEQYLRQLVQNCHEKRH